MNVLVTGAAGFIGHSLVLKLLQTQKGVRITGLDDLNDYYSVSLKEWRLRQITESASLHHGCEWRFVKGSIADKALVSSLFDQEDFDIVVHLAAQAGVRYSIENPDAYIKSNLLGFFNILEACRHSIDASGGAGVRHLVYASSSSVYGCNSKVPFSEEDRTDNPMSLYAATKKSDELLAYTYSSLYGIPCTGLRFFTVYGPAGRPDMAYFDFTERLLRAEKIKIYNFGHCFRDFTYIDDIIEGVLLVMQKPPVTSDAADGLPSHRIYNIGNGHPENLLEFVSTLQEELTAAGVLPQDYDFEAHRELVPMQKGDVPLTFADVTALERDFGFKPHTPLREGLRRFASWYKECYLALEGVH